MKYEPPLIEILATDAYRKWFDRLRDSHARKVIDARLLRLPPGHPGDVRPVGSGVSELRIHYGPGYRVYYPQRGCEIIVLLAGGDKNSQRFDIARALELARCV